MITGFSRVDGRSVGIVANQPAVMGGVPTPTAPKGHPLHPAVRRPPNIPLVFLVDTPGVLPGLAEEQRAPSGAPDASDTPPWKPRYPR